MFALIGTIVQSVIGGVLSPLSAYLGKKQDVNLAEYQAMTSTERDEYAAYVTALSASNQAKIQANGWWGAHLMICLFGFPVALHWSAVFISSTFPLWYHTWISEALPLALPATYAAAEPTLALSFFILAHTFPIVSSVADMLHKRV